MKTLRSRSLAIIIGMLICWLLPSYICASVQVDGIYYDLNTTQGTATVARANYYSGSIIIPASIVYDGHTYSVTSIGEGSFISCTSLQNITISNSVTSIETCAFQDCTGLYSVTLGNSLTSIGNGAFSNCTSLTSLEILNSVTSIGSGAFSGCAGLTSVTIGNNVTSIGSMAFSRCTGLTSISVDSGNTIYDSRNDCNAIIETATNTLITGCKNTIIPNSVTSIGSSAFRGCTSLTSVTIPNSATSIGSSAFRGCSGLTSVTIGNSVSSIGISAFNGCIGLTSIIVKGETPASTEPATFSNVDKSNCALYVPLGCKTAYEDAERWSDFQNIVEYTPGQEVLATGSCGDNVTYTIFSDMSMVVFGTGRMMDYPYDAHINDEYYQSIQEVIIKEGVTTIGDLAFSGCTSLSSVTIPNSVTNIGNETFYGCTGLTSVMIPNSVTSIGGEAFYGCTGLTSIIVKGETPASVGYSTFNKVNKTSCTLYVPAGSKSAYENAEGWRDFQNIVENTPSPKVLATGSCGDNVTYTIFSDMSMVVFGTGRMMDYPYDAHINDEYYQSIQEVIIKEGVTTIGDLAFSGCTSLSSVTIPNSVTSIGNEAFYGCTGLTSVEIPNSVTSIGDWAFYGCSGLTSIEIPNSMTNVGNRAFYGCTGLTSVTIPNSVTSIDNSAFCGCSGLTSIDIPNSVTSINRCAFYGCTGLTSVPIPNSVTEIGEYAFYGCTSLNSIIIPNSVTDIGGSAFSYCTGLISMLVDANNQEFDSRDNCNAIIATSANTLIAGCENTVIPNSVTSIGDRAFYGCSGLTSIEIPNSVTTIDSYAFSGCTSLNSIIIPNSVTNIRNSAFDGCTGLISVKISNSVTSIVSAFNGCTGLTSIIVERETPPFVNRNTFNRVNKTNCTLYVPVGSKSAYENAIFWNEFENIVEVEFDTDISTLDNAIYVEQTEGRIGGTKDILVKMKNNFDVRGFQFTMELPEGATIHSWTLNQGRMPAGTTMNKVFSTEGINENVINVVCALNDGEKTFTGNDGLIATVNVSFAEDMEEGTYPIYLTNNSISDATAEYQLELSDIKSTLVLEDYVVGDTNGDGKVLVGDVIAILNYIVGSPSNNFNTKAADVNGDGKILVGDVIAVLNIIVNQ